MTTKVDFDEHARTYSESINSSLGILGENDIFFDLNKIYCIHKWVASDDQTWNILDYGGGIGKLTGLLAREYPNSTICGYDISTESINVAKEKYANLKNVSFTDKIPQDQKFNFIIVANVFHHIEPKERNATLHKIKNLLKPGGKVVVFEHNPLNPVTRRVVNRCPFDKDAVLLSRSEFISLADGCGLKTEQKRYIVFFPWSSSLLKKLEGLLGVVPLGAQYMLVMAEK